MSGGALTACALVLIVTGLMSAVLSALETALFVLKEHHAVTLARRSPHLAGILRGIARRPKRSINLVLMLSTVVNLAMAVMALMLVREGRDYYAGQPYWMAIVLFAGLITAFDLIPKIVALAAPAPLFRLTVKPLILLSPALEPLTATFMRMTDRAASFLIPSRLKPRLGFTDDELETLVEMREEEGTLQKSESEIIQEIIRLGDKTVKDCMTPRIEAFMIARDAPPAEVREQVRRQTHWRVPVFDQSPDVIVGVLDVKAFLQGGGRSLDGCIRPPVFVPETMMALDAFRNYLRGPRSLAIVLDEYGGVEGLISHTDLIEELIGEVAPLPDVDPEILDLGRGRLLVSGSVRLDEIGEELGLDLESEGLDTIGGLIFNELGELPEPGTTFEKNGIRAVVRKCSEKRIEEVLIQKISGNDRDKRGEESEGTEDEEETT